jgi:hypothetical protein
MNNQYTRFPSARNDFHTKIVFIAYIINYFRNQFDICDSISMFIFTGTAPSNICVENKNIVSVLIFREASALVSHV